jgi:6-phosphogluconolactonase
MTAAITALAIPKNSAELRTFPDQPSMTRAAAEEIVAVACEAVAQRGAFTIALSGGPAPGPIFEMLADESQPYRDTMPWDHAHFFWGDERHVPPEHPKSNYRLAYSKMLSRVPVPERNVHRVRSEISDAHEAARLYELTVRDYFQAPYGEWPVFDLMLQGLGANGHTASLFPGTTALAERERLVVANWVEKFKSYRITMTLPVINHAARVLFAVSGSKPADALYEVLYGVAGSAPLPAELVASGAGRLLWLADSEAARQLPARNT